MSMIRNNKHIYSNITYFVHGRNMQMDQKCALLILLENMDSKITFSVHPSHSLKEYFQAVSSGSSNP